MPDEKVEPGFCSTRSNYHIVKGILFALFQTGAYIHLCTSLTLIFHFLAPGTSWKFLLSSTGVLHIKLAICIKKMSFRRNDVGVKLDKLTLDFTS